MTDEEEKKQLEVYRKSLEALEEKSFPDDKDYKKPKWYVKYVNPVRLFNLICSNLEDRKLFKAMDYDSEHEAEMIITHGMGWNRWTDFLKEASTFSAIMLNFDLSSSDISKQVFRSRKIYRRFTFFKNLYIMVMLPFKQISTLIHIFIER